jgi:hypothetical protein
MTCGDKKKAAEARTTGYEVHLNMEMLQSATSFRNIGDSRIQNIISSIQNRVPLFFIGIPEKKCLRGAQRHLDVVNSDCKPPGP